MIQKQNTMQKKTSPGRVSASELGVYETCRRAWWYQRRGLLRSNARELESGQAYHHRIGLKLLLLRTARLLLMLLFVLSAAIILYALLAQDGTQ